MDLFEALADLLEGLAEAGFESALEFLINGKADLFQLLFGIGADFSKIAALVLGEAGEAVLERVIQRLQGVGEFLSLGGHAGLECALDAFLAAVYAFETILDGAEIGGLRLAKE
jgi:hypothetical protein